MIAYELYWRDRKGRDHLIGILPERITFESVMNWGRNVIAYDEDVKNVLCMKVEIDEAQIQSSGLIPLSELRKQLKK